MPRRCVICNVYDIHSDRSFHSFPKDEGRKKLWLKACGIGPYLPSYRVCNSHFSNEDYLSNGHLSSIAIPVNIKSKQPELLESANTVFESASQETLSPEKITIVSTNSLCVTPKKRCSSGSPDVSIAIPVNINSKQPELLESTNTVFESTSQEILLLEKITIVSTNSLCVTPKKRCSSGLPDVRSSNVRCTSNKSNQNQNSESKLSNKISVPGSTYENIINNQMGCLEVSTSNNENTIGKNITGNIYGHSSSGQHKLKSKERYGHYEILEHKSNPESKKLKMDFVKLDKHTKRRENCNPDISCNVKQTNDKPVNVEKAQEIISKKNSLRVCCISGDRLSIHKPTSLGISNLYDMGDDKSHHNSINKSVNLNINHGFNDERFPLLSSRISDVKGKLNTSKINSSASDNYDLITWMKAKTNCEVVLPNSEILLEAGQQIVNYGGLIHSNIYRLIDTAYTKDYKRKVRDFPMNVLKTQLAFDKMSALPGILSLFKCMDRSCTKMFNSKEFFKFHMQIHYSEYYALKKKKKIQQYDVQQFKMCAYCFKAFDDVESLADHIAEKYTFCEYFCPHCFYRAYTASHVLVHQSVVHTNINKNLIIKLDGSTRENPKETVLQVVDFKTFVLPYICDVDCCTFSCYLPNEFVEHLNQDHQQDDTFYCYICALKDEGERFFELHPDLIMTHFKLHHLNKYQCIFCLFGSETIDSMIEHLAFEHFEYEPLCLERSTVSNNCESKNIRNLKILRLKKDIDDGMVKNVPMETISIPDIESSDNQSLVMKFAHIDEGSQPSDTVDYKFPSSALMAESSTSMSLANDVNQNHMNGQTSSNDIVLSVREELNVVPKKQRCLEIDESVIELDKLFVCKECDKYFSNDDLYFAHLKVCPFWDDVAGRQCIHCRKVYKQKSKLAKHIKLHGPDRFKCYLCKLKAPSQRAIRLHMKVFHRIVNIDFVPEHPNLTDLDKDNFIVLECKTVKQKVTQEQPNDTNNFVNSLMTQQNTNSKRKHCSTIERDELDKKIIEVTLDDNIDIEIYPRFIQQNMRYKCSIPLCNFIGKTYDMLKKHMSIHHPAYQYYICPHCRLPQGIISEAVEQNQLEFHLMHHGSNLYRCQYCNYIHFNRVEMRTHMRNTHLLEITSSVQSNIIVIRQTMLEDDSIDRSRNKEECIKSNYGDDTDIFNDDNNIQGSKHTSIESSIDKCIKPNDEEITKEKKKIPKSRDNGNYRDYVYLDTLDGDDAKNVLSFEKKSISKNSKTKVLQLLEKNHTDGIPESILYNQDLTECYGEMLSASCDQDCQLICYYSIPGPDRTQIYKEFQMLNATEQNCKITQLVQLRIFKKKDKTFESCPTYRFIWKRAFIKVCRTFFMNTLGISDNRLNAILEPKNYSWYSDRDIALKANQPRQLNIISEPVDMTDFMKESLKELNKDYNSFELESEPDVSIESVPLKEYQNIIQYMKSIPRVLSSQQIPGTSKRQYFETSISLDHMFKTYSENFMRNKKPPPVTKRQFQKIYNQYMKTFLKMV